MIVSAVAEKKFFDANQSLTRNPEVLYVTTASTPDSKSSNETMKYFLHNFMHRENSDKEIWLFGIDASMKESNGHDM